MVLFAGAGFLRARALARWAANVAQRALFFEFGHEQADTIGQPKDAEDAEKIGESDVAVARFEILVALNRDSGSPCDFGLGPVAPEALRAKTGEQRSHHDALSTTRQSTGFIPIHIPYFNRN
jgi:hypothetical protein